MTEGPPTRVTVAVATYRRVDRVSRLLRALERQTIGPDSFEVVVSDDASGGDAVARLRAAADGSRLRVQVVAGERNGGPAVARERAWRAGTAPVVAFTDDDCVPDADWLERGLAALGDDDAFVVGHTEPDPAQLSQLGAFSRTMRVDDARFMQTCNAFYRLADLEAVGGFDPAHRTGEDVDLGLRVHALGREIRYAGDVRVLHDVRPSSFRATLRESWSWVDLPRLHRRHPAHRSRLFFARHFWKPTHPLVLLAVTGLAAAWRWPPAALLVLPWVRFRVVRWPLVPGRRRRWLVLPGAFVVDVVEVVTMLRGSVKHRTVLL